MTNDMLIIIVVAIGGIVIALLLFILSYLKKDDYNKNKKHYKIIPQPTKFEKLIKQINNAKDIIELDKCYNTILSFNQIELYTKEERQEFGEVYKLFICHPLTTTKKIAKLTIALKNKNKSYKDFFIKKEKEALEKKLYF
jgi:hypothetical protein